MNRGLLGNPVVRGLGGLAVYASPALPLAGGNAGTEVFNPFGVPVIGRSVLKCIAPINGFNVGDLWHTPYVGIDSTVGTTLWGYVRNDGVKLRSTNGSAGYRFNQFIDGSAGSTPASANFSDQYLLVGPHQADNPDVAHLPRLQRFTTPVRPYAASVNYIESNLLGRQPAFVNVFYKCRLPEMGYLPGDIVGRDLHQIINGGTTFTTDSVRTTEKIIEVRTPAAAHLVFIHQTTGVNTVATPTNWQLFMEVLG